MPSYSFIAYVFINSAAISNEIPFGLHSRLSKTHWLNNHFVRRIRYLVFIFHRSSSPGGSFLARFLCNTRVINRTARGILYQPRRCKKKTWSEVSSDLWWAEAGNCKSRFPRSVHFVAQERPILEPITEINLH